MYSELDLMAIVEGSPEFLRRYSNKSICIAGATGFIGSWLISFLDFANAHYSTNFEIIALSRNPSEPLESKLKSVRFLNSDISVETPSISTAIDLIINAATPSSPNHGGNDPHQILNSSITGVENLITLGGFSKSAFINLSSGIVSKRQDATQLNPYLISDAYLHGKRKSEEIVTSANREGRIKGKNLRLYAFAGPGISLVDHFAVGNFLNDAIHRKPISIRGNPSTRRSYLYPTDLIVNILASEAFQEDRPLEIGSSSPVSMKDLADSINKITGNNGINQSTDYGPADSYFPISRDLLMDPEITLDNAIKRWVTWLSKS
jgi:nucleoside-diphosphate-sugar epimerase